MATPRLENIAEKYGFLTLLANTYADHLLDKEMRARQFDVLSRMVKHVPLKYFWTRKGIQYLPRLCDAIYEDISQMQDQKDSRASFAR